MHTTPHITLHPCTMALAAMLTAMALTTARAANADVFGGQVHATRSKGALDGVSIRCGECSEVPSSYGVEGNGELVGADFRFDWMLGDLRVGSGVGIFAARHLRLSLAQPSNDGVHVKNGLGASFEASAGYEFLTGPLYLYVDARAVAQGLEVPVQRQKASTGASIDRNYRVASVGFGPRLGMLVPVGHSLMIDLAVYQHVVGGLEQSSAFVGLGYWENDRDDAFSNELRRSFGGEF